MSTILIVMFEIWSILILGVFIAAAILNTKGKGEKKRNDS